MKIDEDFKKPLVAFRPIVTQSNIEDCIGKMSCWQFWYLFAVSQKEQNPEYIQMLQEHAANFVVDVINYKSYDWIVQKIVNYNKENKFLKEEIGFCNKLSEFEHVYEVFKNI